MAKDKIIERLDALIAKFPERKDANKKLEHVKWVLNESEIDLIPAQIFSQSNTHVSNIERNSANATSYIGWVDKLLMLYSSPWNKKRTKSETKSLIDQVKKDADSEIKTAKNKLNDLENQITEKKKAFEDLTKDLSAVQTKLNNEAKRLDVLVTNEQAALAEKKTKLDESNAAFIQKTQEDITGKVNKNIQTLKTNFETDADGLRSEIMRFRTESESDRDRIKELLGITSSDILTKDYSDLANEEQTPSFLWGLAALGAYSAIPISAIISVICYGFPETLDLSSLLFRFSLPFSFLIVGLYASRKSTNHRETFIRAKRTHIRISTLEPYLENFAPEKRDEIRENLVEEFFKDKETSTQKTPLVGLSLKQVNELLDKIKSMIRT